MNRPSVNGLLQGLYAITPDCADGANLIASVQAVLSGGCRLVQYRDKISTPNEKFNRAKQLKDICSSAGAVLIINDDVDLAVSVGAHGLHLGSGDGDISEARELLGSDAIVGASCYADLNRAAQAQLAGANYVAFGAVFPSATKPGAAPVPLSLIQQAHTLFSIPVCAIGGISLANAPSVIAAGADMVAVITDLFSSPDVTVRAEAFQCLFQDR